MFVQVKSSFRNKRSFENRRRPSHILVLVVRPRDSLDLTRSILVQLLEKERASIIYRRLRS
jgi:hypothetical protein